MASSLFVLGSSFQCVKNRCKNIIVTFIHFIYIFSTPHVTYNTASRYKMNAYTNMVWRKLTRKIEELCRELTSLRKNTNRRKSNRQISQLNYKHQLQEPIHNLTIPMSPSPPLNFTYTSLTYVVGSCSHLLCNYDNDITTLEAKTVLFLAQRHALVCNLIAQFYSSH